MTTDQISMLFFRNAGLVCLTAAAAAFMIAVSMFFLFDIRTIYMIRSGLAAQADLLMKAQSPAQYDPVQDFSFRVVRRTIITDTEEVITLREYPDCGAGM